MKKIFIPVIILCFLGAVTFTVGTKLFSGGKTEKTPTSQKEQNGSNTGSSKGPTETPQPSSTPKAEETAKEEEKKDEVPVKPDSAYAEEVVNNFSVLYPSTVNKGRTMDMLSSIILPNSEFYISTKSQLEKYTKSKTKIQFANFEILEVNYIGNEEFDIKVSQELEVTSAGKTETKAEKLIYRVKSTKEKTGIMKASVEK